MKTYKYFYLLGCISYILVGIGHVGTSLSTVKTEELLRVLEVMEKYEISIAGGKSNLLLFHDGFSFMMGVLWIAYGMINVIFIRIGPQIIMEKHSILVLNIFVSFIAVALSAYYLFVIPVVFTSVSLVSYLLARVAAIKFLRSRPKSHLLWTDLIKGFVELVEMRGKSLLK